MLKYGLGPVKACLAGEEAKGTVGRFREAYAWSDLDVGGVGAVVGDLDGGVG
jgi:hypothetical protein